MLLLTNGIYSLLVVECITEQDIVFNKILENVGIGETLTPLNQEVKIFSATTDVLQMYIFCRAHHCDMQCNFRKLLTVARIRRLVISFLDKLLFAHGTSQWNHCLCN
jgi:hypothetical protein